MTRDKRETPHTTVNISVVRKWLMAMWDDRKDDGWKKRDDDNDKIPLMRNEGNENDDDAMISWHTKHCY